MRDTILFDINETVLDLNSLAPHFQRAFGDQEVSAYWFASLLHSSTVCALTDVRTNFASLAAVVLDAVAAKRNTSLSATQREELMDAFANLKPHPDVVPAVSFLRDSGYRTVAFSNSSSDLITNQLTNAGIMDCFDEIVSVEQTGTFKPDSRVYRYAANSLARLTSELWLVACHDWDIHGAMVAGIEGAFVDRSGAIYHPLYRRPVVFGRSMLDVAEQITASAASYALADKPVFP